MSIRTNTLWNIFGSVGPMFVGLIAIPYIYKQIGVERTGALTIIWSLIGYFSIFDFGLGRAITQRLAGRVAKASETAATGVFLTLIVGVVGAGVGFFIIEVGDLRWLNYSKNLDREIYVSLALACVAVPATTVTVGLRGVLEGLREFKVINILRFFLGLFNFIGPVVAIAFFGPRLEYIVGSLVVARYFILAAHYFAGKQYLQFYANISLAESKLLFKFGGWMTLSNVVSPLMVVADRLFIANLLGASVVAYYTIPAEFMIRLLVVPSAITTALFPVFAKGFSEKTDGSIAHYKKGVKTILLLMTPITAFVIIGSNFSLTLWLGSEFAEKSTWVVSILAVGILFNSVAQIPHAYIQASGDSKSTALIHVAESMLYLPVLFLMMRLFGIEGVALAWTFRALADLILLNYRASLLKND